MFSCKGEGNCNSWKDLSCLAAGEVWRTKCFGRSLFPACPSAVCSSCGQRSSGQDPWAAPTMSQFAALTSTAGILWIFPNGSSEQNEADAFTYCHCSSFQQQINVTRQCRVCCCSSFLVLSALLASLLLELLQLQAPTELWKHYRDPIARCYPFLTLFFLVCQQVLNTKDVLKYPFFSTECFKWSNRVSEVYG